MLDKSDGQPASKPITGRTVLFWIIGFFAVVFAANGVFIYLALGSFPGVVVESSYKAGQAYNQDITAAKAQADRGWQVAAFLDRGRDRNAILRVDAKDKLGQTLSGLRFTASLEHPAHQGGDIELALQEIEAGVYQGIAEGLDSGNWELVIEARDGEARVFRSKNRLFLSE